MLHLLLAAVAVGGGGATLEGVVGAGADPCKGLTSLDAWLCAATFTLPSLSLDEGTIKVTINELVCQHAKVGTLTTKPIPDAGGGKTPEFFFSFSDVAIHCSSSSVHFDKPIPLKTSMTVDISGVQAESTLQLTVDKDGLPTAAALLNTNAIVGDLRLSILHLPSFLLQPIVNAFKSKITSSIVSVRGHPPPPSPPPRTRASLPRCASPHTPEETRLIGHHSSAPPGSPTPTRRRSMGW